jgi:hypothetical protein
MVAMETKRIIFILIPHVYMSVYQRIILERTQNNLFQYGHMKIYSQAGGLIKTAVLSRRWAAFTIRRAHLR